MEGVLAMCRACGVTPPPPPPPKKAPPSPPAKAAGGLPTSQLAQEAVAAMPAPSAKAKAKGKGKSQKPVAESDAKDAAPSVQAAGEAPKLKGKGKGLSSQSAAGAAATEGALTTAGGGVTAVGTGKKGSGKGKGKVGPTSGPGKAPPLAPKVGGAGGGSGKSKAGKFQPTKPKRKAPFVMKEFYCKPMWLNKMGQAINLEMTLWKEVPDYCDRIDLEEMKEYFGPAQKAQPVVKEDKEEDGGDQQMVKEQKIPEIAYPEADQKTIMAATLDLQAVPLDEVFEALETGLLVGGVTRMHTQALMKWAIAKEDKIEWLKAQQQSNPKAKFALWEGIIMQAAKILHFAEKVTLLNFQLSAPEDAAEEAIFFNDLNFIMDSLLQSKALVQLMTIFLAIANIINSGRNSGQADAFHPECAVPVAELYLDNDGHVLTKFVWAQMHKLTPEMMEEIIDDVKPALVTMWRSPMLSAGEEIKDQPWVRECKKNLDERLKSTKALVKQAAEARQAIKALAQKTNNPEDPFLKSCEESARMIDKLEKLTDSTAKKFTALHRWLGIPDQVEGKDFTFMRMCEILDELFLSGRQLQYHGKFGRKDFVKTFIGQGKCFTFQDFMMLWQLEDYSEKKFMKQAPAVAERSRPLRHRVEVEADGMIKLLPSGVDAEHGRIPAAGAVVHGGTSVATDTTAIAEAEPRAAAKATLEPKAKGQKGNGKGKQQVVEGAADGDTV